MHTEVGMDDTIVRRHTRPARIAIAGLALGVLLGSWFGTGSGRARAERQIPAAGHAVDATHLPPLLTTSGEDVVLRYDVHCTSAAEGAEDVSQEVAGCASGGTVFIRTGTSGSFRPLPLVFDPSAAEGRWAAHVPAEVAASRNGFSYYAVLHSSEDDVPTTVPPGGASSPHRSVPMGRAVDVPLGRHEFGKIRPADDRVLESRWGAGTGEIGLEAGTNVTPTGGSSFDIGADGAVSVLDEVNRRVLRWAPGAASPAAIPVTVDGTIADLSVAADGSMYVLESARTGRGPVLRSLGRSGVMLESSELPERTATQVRVGPSGPVVLQQPSGQWVSVGRSNGSTSASSHGLGTAGRPFPGGSEVVTLRTGRELRLALVSGDVVRRSWRITSTTPLGEVQLAEPLGLGLLVVVRVYTDVQDEFLALVLGQRGVVREVSLGSADWAESAPLSRFRLFGSSLYRLGSTANGLFVDRFDMEVK
jgi:hypothetical protein